MLTESNQGNSFRVFNSITEAEKLILLHGSTMNSIMWLGDAVEYSRDYRVYTVEIPGEPGRSEENLSQ